MSKRIRTFIFSACLFLFFFISPLAVFYSQGYRLDFESKKISQTGGIFLKISPRQANIYVDGSLKKKTDFFFGSALIENLLPKKYRIEVKKENYHSWEKTLEIKEKQVAEAKNIILFPEKINFAPLFLKTEDFWFSPDQKKLILMEDPAKGEENGWSLKSYDLNKNIKSHLASSQDFLLSFPPDKKEFVQLDKLDFSEDSKKIYLKMKAKEEVRYFFLDADEAKPLPREVNFFRTVVEGALAYKEVGGNIYYLDNSGHLFKSKNFSDFESENKQPFSSLPPSFLDPLAQENKKEKEIFFFDPSKDPTNREKLTLEPFPLKKQAQYSLQTLQDLIFLRENDSLYKFESASKSFEYFFEKANPLKISPDNKKLAYFSDHEIWILFLSDKNDPPAKKSGESIFLIRLSERIIDLSWINSDYLIFQTEEKIKISETDERDKINVIDFLEIKNFAQNGKSLKITFNQFDKKIYLLNEKILYRSDSLLP